MTDYLVTDTELTSIANAIRTKGGTNASLTFPAGFISAIEDLEAGGAGAETELVDITVSGNVSEYYLPAEGSYSFGTFTVPANSMFVVIVSGSYSLKTPMHATIDFVGNVGTNNLYCVYAQDQDGSVVVGPIGQDTM